MRRSCRRPWQRRVPFRHPHPCPHPLEEEEEAMMEEAARGGGAGAGAAVPEEEEEATVAGGAAAAAATEAIGETEEGGMMTIGAGETDAEEEERGVTGRVVEEGEEEGEPSWMPLYWVGCTEGWCRASWTLAAS